MARSIDQEIRRFQRRVGWARFVGGTCEALVVVSIGLATVLLALRLFGVVPEPSAWWALLALPAVGWGVLAARRLGFSRRLGAAHLDQRLGLDGLLLTALERDTRAYDARIRARLAEAQAAQPRLRLQAPLLRVGLAAVVVLVLLVLPDPAPDAAAANPIASETLEAYEEKLAALEKQEGLQEETREELAKRLDELQQDFKKDGQVGWKDLDAFEQAMQHEQSLQGARIEHARQDLAAFARGEDESLAAGARAAAERMAALLAGAQSAGLLDRLPEGMRAQLGTLASENDAAGLAKAFDATALRQLAAALAQCADDKLGELAEAGLAAPSSIPLPSLEELMQGVDMKDVFGKPCSLCKGTGKKGTGKKGASDCPG